MWKSIVGCLLFPFLDKSIPSIVLWKSKYGNRYYCLNRNTFSIFRKVVPQKEKEKTKFGKQVLFPNRDILWKPNENHKKNMNFMWKTWNFFPVHTGGIVQRGDCQKKHWCFLVGLASKGHRPHFSLQQDILQLHIPDSKNFLNSLELFYSGGTRRGARGPRPLLYFYSKGSRGQKKKLNTGPSSYLRVWMTRTPPFLKVWICHWLFILTNFICCFGLLVLFLCGLFQVLLMTTSTV